MWVLRHLLCLLALCVLTSGAVGEERPASASVSFRLIAHPSNSLTSVERRFVADAFLKKVTRWASGEVIRPVDLTPGSPVRRSFSDEVLGRSVEAVKNFWQQAIFSGRDVPPPELDAEDEVVRYVLKHPGAIGYVSTSVGLDGAKILTVR
jgi:ABC-type phosphate transport system substrate-binding protein